MRLPLLVIATLLLSRLTGQATAYPTLTDTNVVWSIAGSLEQPGIDVFQMRVGRDSAEINGLRYRGLEIYRPSEDDSFRGSPYYLREIGKKVYFLNAIPDRNGQIGAEELLYDFGLAVGDTMPLPAYFSPPNGYSLYVAETDSVTLEDGSRRKRWTLLCKPGPGKDPLPGTAQQWIEGIGATDAFLQPGYGCTADAGPGPLLCVAYAGEVIYRNVSDCTDVESPAGTARVLRADRVLHAFPNPAIDAVHLEEWTEGLPYRVYNALGRKIAEGRVRGRSVTLVRVTRGTYTLRLRDASGRGHTARSLVL